MERFNYIYKACYPFGNVLNVGCTGDDENWDNDWGEGKMSLHRLLSLSQDVRLTGIDINEDKLDLMKKLGYEVYHEDAENLSTGFLQRRRFYYHRIVAGEIIEHLQDLRKFLQGMFYLLKHEGILVMTTPNPYSASIIAQNLLNIPEDKWVSPHHTCWFTPLVLKKLLLENKFELIDIKYLDVDRNIYRSRKLRRTKKLFEIGRFKPIIGLMAKKLNE